MHWVQWTHGGLNKYLHIFYFLFTPSFMKEIFTRCSKHWHLLRRLHERNWIRVSDIEGTVKSGERETLVYVSPDKTKALRINHGMWKDFALYVDVARAIPNNPYIQNVGHDFFLDDGTYCVELEPLLEANSVEASLKARGKYIILRNLINHPFKDSRPEMIDRLLKKDSDLKEAMSALFAFQQNAYNQDKKFDVFLDLHGRNFMIRNDGPDGHVVLSDPFTYFPDENETPEPQAACNILWRRKLGFLDFQDGWKRDWEIESSKCGSGCFVNF